MDYFVPSSHVKRQRSSSTMPVINAAYALTIPSNDPPPYIRNKAKSSQEVTSIIATDVQDGIFTPSSPPTVVSSLRKASSSSQLDQRGDHVREGNESMSDDEGFLWASWNSQVGSRSRPGLGSLKKVKSISTGLQRGAGETETELDEPPKHLPTSRRVPTPPAIGPLTTLARITPALFQIFRLLAVVPAVAGALYHLLKTYAPDGQHSRIDHFVCILWTLLTAHQCLRLTTGLLIRWKAYYPPLATHIRLLALQAICWPATQFALLLFNHSKRPVVCWAIIGSTTSISRSIQIWVTSNLWGGDKKAGGEGTSVKWGPRRWDWTEVGIKCGLPMGVMYFVMAWAEALRRELDGC